MPVFLRDIRGLEALSEGGSMLDGGELAQASIPVWGQW
jgi:hypothetical protein